MAETETRPMIGALDELERLLEHLTEELAGWRRRTLAAEAEVSELKGRAGVVASPELQKSRDRVLELEQENQGLRQRVDAARERVRALAERLAFLEQGAEVE